MASMSHEINGEDDDDDNELDPQVLDQFDYFRFTLTEFHGSGYTMSVPRRHIEHALRHGLRIPAGVFCLTVTTGLALGDEDPFQRFNNAQFLAKKSTLRGLPWAAGGKHRVGEFLCELSWMPSYRGGSVIEASPRFIARRQLQRLVQLGYRLYSSFESEFTVLQRSDLKPIFGGPLHSSVYSTEVTAEFETFLYDAEKLLNQGGIDIGKLHIEYGPGQLEFVPQPKFGIESADTMFRLREAMKEICGQRGWKATFMTKPFPEWPGSGLHFNHSLWSVKSHENVMCDASQRDNLSDICRHWVAGLLKHSAALTALCCPTVNCYRRLRGNFTPTFADWGIDNRHATFRVKNSGAEETYIENRLPSSPANPYLVLAATVAAGLDGIVNKLPCPPERNEGSDGQPLVSSLDKALDSLQNDEVMKEALGEEFVKLFEKNKREGEIEKLLGINSFEDERKIYLTNI